MVLADVQGRILGARPHLGVGRFVYQNLLFELRLFVLTGRIGGRLLDDAILVGKVRLAIEFRDRGGACRKCQQDSEHGQAGAAEHIHNAG